MYDIALDKKYVPVNYSCIIPSLYQDHKTSTDVVDKYKSGYTQTQLFINTDNPLL